MFIVKHCREMEILDINSSETSMSGDDSDEEGYRSSSSLDTRDPSEAGPSQSYGGYVDSGVLFPGYVPNVRHPQASDALVVTELPTGRCPLHRHWFRSGSF